jgi:hypothetical protein
MLARCLHPRGAILLAVGGLLLLPAAAPAASAVKKGSYSGTSSRDHNALLLAVGATGKSGTFHYHCGAGRRNDVTAKLRIAHGVFAGKSRIHGRVNLDVRGKFRSSTEARGKLRMHLGCKLHTETFKLLRAVHAPSAQPPATSTPPATPTPTPAPAAPRGEIVFHCVPNICAANTDGTNRRQLTTDGTDSAQYGLAALSRDGTKMVFTGKDGKPYAADANAGNPRLLTSANAASAPQIRADGNEVLWTHSTNFPIQFVTETEKFDGSGHTSTVVGDSQAGFTGASQYVCATRNPNEIDIGDHVGVHDSTGPGDPADPCRRVAYQSVAGSAFGWRPQISPDGRFVVDSFYRNGFSSEGLYLYDTATATLVAQLTTAEDDNPVFSPDGQTILFDRHEGGKYNIYKMPAAGGAPTQLIPDGSVPSWGGG